MRQAALERYQEVRFIWLLVVLAQHVRMTDDNIAVAASWQGPRLLFDFWSL